MCLLMTSRFWLGIIAHKPPFMAEANEQLKDQYAHRLHDQYYTAIAHSALRTSYQMESFTQFCGHLALTFSNHSKLGKISNIRGVMRAYVIKKLLTTSKQNRSTGIKNQQPGGSKSKVNSTFGT